MRSPLRRRPVNPVAAPAVSGFSPSTASASGGSSHVVSGSNFETTYAVLVGGTSATFSVSSVGLSFTAPAKAAEVYPVYVYTAGGSAYALLTYTGGGDALLTEGGDTLTTEAGDRLVLE